jgi:hypothetical protein
MTKATRTSWKTLPAPANRERMSVQETFCEAVASRMRGGHVPVGMDDKWFVYCDDDWLHFHRSWTGAHIYALRLVGGPSGAHVVDGWVNRDPEEYRSPGLEHDQQMVVQLIARYFGE